MPIMTSEGMTDDVIAPSPRQIVSGGCGPAFMLCMYVISAVHGMLDSY